MYFFGISKKIPKILAYHMCLRSLGDAQIEKLFILYAHNSSRDIPPQTKVYLLYNLEFRNTPGTSLEP